LGCLLLAAFSTAVKVGLEPLSRLHAALISLRSGSERRLEGEFPRELLPLVEDITKVLDERARAAEQAKTRAADLAHGLKTPLTANEVMADELRSEGRIGLGSELSEYVATMQRHVERGVGAGAHCLDYAFSQAGADMTDRAGIGAQLEASCQWQGDPIGDRD
jgi:signal transduction histidine kinase